MNAVRLYYIHIYDCYQSRSQSALKKRRLQLWPTKKNRLRNANSIYPSLSPELSWSGALSVDWLRSGLLVGKARLLPEAAAVGGGATRLVGVGVARLAAELLRCTGPTSCFAWPIWSLWTIWEKHLKNILSFLYNNYRYFVLLISLNIHSGIFSTKIFAIHVVHALMEKQDYCL